jgi:hypothetical protein
VKDIRKLPTAIVTLCGVLSLGIELFDRASKIVDSSPVLTFVYRIKRDYTIKIIG